MTEIKKELKKILQDHDICLEEEDSKHFPWLGYHGFLVQCDPDVRQWIKAVKNSFCCRHYKAQEVLSLKRNEAEGYLLEASVPSGQKIVILEDLDLCLNSFLYFATIRLLDSLLLIERDKRPIVVGVISNKTETVPCFQNEIFRFGKQLCMKNPKAVTTNGLDLIFNNTPISLENAVDFHAFIESRTFQKLKNELIPILKQHHPLISKPSGIVVYGESGSGKTFSLRWLMKQLPEYAVIEVPSADLIHKEVGASERSAQEIFRKARERAPAFLIFENFDIICGQGSKLSSKAFTRIQSVLLTEIDRCAEDRSVIPLVTVTNLAQIDYAFLRPGRLEERIELLPLTDLERLNFLRYLFTDVLFLSDANEISQDQLQEFSLSMNSWQIGRISSAVNEALFTTREKIGYDCPMACNEFCPQLARVVPPTTLVFRYG